MADKITNYKCPACGGSVRFEASLGKLKCEYCDTIYEIKDFESQMTEKNDAAAKEWARGDNESYEYEGMKAYNCPSCGAELICDATTAATCCPYCGNQTIVPGNFKESFKPDYVIPFKLEKEQAKAALKKHYEGKKLLPDSFAKENHIEEIQGVYVPFWLYDSVARGDATYEAERIHKEDQGDRELITTEHYEVHRSGSMTFSKVPVDASTRMPDDHMDSIEPYDYKELKTFSMSYMPGYLADRYDVSAEDGEGRMKKRCANSLSSALYASVGSYDNVHPRDENIKVQRTYAYYAMLPVWLLATKWHGENFLFAMNGQSGKLVGNLPVDKGKFWRYFFLYAVLFIAAFTALFKFIVPNPIEGILETVLLCVLLPLLGPFIIVQRMKSSMHSVSSGGAAIKFVADHGFKLTQSQDVHINTTTQVRMKPRKPEENKS